MTYYTIDRAPDGFAAAWPTRGRLFFARLSGAGEPLSQPEIATPGTTGMRTGVLALAAPDGTTLVAWKNDGRLGWQLYDGAGQSAGAPQYVESAGNGAAGVATRDGRFILFR
jgi:hypothetical protein